MDKVARNKQLAGCGAHTGDVYTFVAADLSVPVEWLANIQRETMPGEGKINRLIVPGRVQLTGIRDPFDCAGRLPQVAEDLTDAAGNLYTIAEIPPPLMASNLLTLICTVSLIAPAS